MAIKKSSILAGSVACLFSVAAPAATDVLVAVPGDFEAKVSAPVLASGDGSASVSVLVNRVDVKKAPTFSGKITSGAASVPIAGSFVLDSEGAWVAQVRGVKVLPDFDMFYTAKTVADAEKLVVRLVDSEEEVTAKPSVVLGKDVTARAWALKDTIAGAFRTSLETFEEISGLMESLTGSIAEADESIASLGTNRAELVADAATASADISNAQKKLAAAKLKAPAFFAAQANTEKLKSAYDAALSAGTAALNNALLNAGAVTKDEIVEEDTPGKIALIGVDDYVKAKMSDGDTFAVALKKVQTQLSTVVAAMSVTALDTALGKVEFSFALPDLSQVGGTESVKLARIKSFFGVLSTQASALSTASNNYSVAEQVLADSYATLSPVILEEIEDANLTIEDAGQNLESANSSLTVVDEEIAAAKKARETLVLEKGAWAAKMSLSGYAGYGTYSGAVTGSTDVSGQPSIPVSVSVAGTSPNGQKFTYSTKLRSETAGEGVGVFYVNTTAGPAKISLDIAYAVDSEKKTGGPASGQQEVVIWGGVNADHIAGSAVFPTKVTDQTRADKNRSMNIFGGPTDDDGLVRLGGTATQPVMVSFGETEESGFKNMFGLAVNNTNQVMKLRAAPSGSTFVLSLGDGIAPSFSGSYPNGQQAGTLAGFSGVFLKTQVDDKTVVRGFGAHQVSATSSQVVEVSPDVPEGTAPVTPDAPAKSPIVWGTLANGVFSFKVADMPEFSNVTTLVLFKGGNEVARAVAARDGSASIPANLLSKGDDYTVQVLRETVSGEDSSEVSGAFAIDVRALPAYTYQTLLSSDEDVPVRGRLTVSTLPSGAWTGRIEWVSLTPVPDEGGEFVPEAVVPSVKTATIKGQLASSNEEDLSELSGTTTVALESGPVHSLRLFVKDAEAPESSFGASTDDLSAMGFRCSLRADVAEDTEGVATYSGNGFPAVKAVAAASGKYRTVSVSDGKILNNHSHSIDYSGNNVATYSFRNGDSGGLLSSSRVLLDGSIPVLTVGNVGRYARTYTNAANKRVVVPMANPMALATTAVLTGETESGETKPRYTASISDLYASGAELEVAPKVAGGYVFRSDWSEEIPKNGFGDWFINSVVETLPAKRYVDFASGDRFAVETAYTLELVSGSGEQVETLWSGEVTFSARGVASVADFQNQPAAQRPVSLTVSTQNGTISASVKVGTVDGAVAFNPLTGGRFVKLSGFALPTNDLSALGWCGVEGRNLSLRLKAAQ